MKKIYEFVLQKKEVIEVSVKEGNDENEITTTKKEKRLIDKKFFLRKPTRKLFDEAELFYGVKLAEGIKAGLLTRALLAKRFNNDGGVLSDHEREEFGRLYNEIFDKQVELQTIILKKESEITEEDKKKKEEVTSFLKTARSRIQEFESNQASLYDQTAENRARNKTILWWVLHLSFAKNGEEEISFFGDGEYESKLKAYDKIEDTDDDWEMEVVNKFFYYVSFWFVSKASDQEQFDALIKFAEQKEEIQTSKNDKDESSEKEPEKAPVQETASPPETEKE